MRLQDTKTGRQASMRIKIYRSLICFQVSSNDNTSELSITGNRSSLEFSFHEKQQPLRRASDGERKNRRSCGLDKKNSPMQWKGAGALSCQGIARPRCGPNPVFLS